MKLRAALTLWAALACVATQAQAASPLAADAAPDTSLQRFLHAYSDSTEAYFGMTATPTDTAGLDSALAFGLESPERAGRGRRKLALGPWFAFNRVDGARYGATLGIGDQRQLGELKGRAGYLSGPNLWQGGAEYTKIWGSRRAPTTWLFNVSGGRFTNSIDRDRSDKALAWVRALLSGSDRQHYLRRDGMLFRVERETPWLRLGVGYSDELESPLTVTTGWNLSHRPLSVTDNLQARFGRARELELNGTVRLPLVPGFAQLEYRTSGEAMNSDFSYRRTRFAAGAEIGVGGIVSLVPQLEYGRLTGELVPQAAFYFGGSRSLRTVESGALGGTGKALARLDVIGARDIMGATRILGLPAMAVTAGVFAATGAVWGEDPYGGPTQPGVDWPERQQWLSEVGVSLLLRPGVPDPAGFIHFDYGVPIGPQDRSARFSLYYARPLFLVKPIVR